MQDMIWKDQETRGQRDTRIWEEGHWGRGSTAQPASSGRTRWGEACVSSKYTEEGQEIILRTEVLGRRSQDHGGAPESSSFRIWRIFSREPGGAVPGLQNDPTEQGRWSPSSPDWPGEGLGPGSGNTQQVLTPRGWGTVSPRWTWGSERQDAKGKLGNLRRSGFPCHDQKYNSTTN